MKSNKLKDIALFSEIVGGAAILVTLILLVVEINQNTTSLKASTYDTIQGDIASLRASFATEESLAEVRLSVQTSGIDSLTPLQQVQWNEYHTSLFLLFERAFIQWSAGNMEDDQWQRFHDSLCRFYQSSDFRESVYPTLRNATTTRFQEYIEAECS